MFLHRLPQTESVSRYVQWIPQILICIVPFILIPFTQNLFDSAKIAVIFFGFLTMTALWAVSLFQQKKLTITFHKLTVPLLGFGFSILLSSVLSRTPMIEAQTSIYGVYLFLIIMTVLSTSFLKITQFSHYFDLVLAAACGVILISVLQMIGVGPSIFINAVFNLGVANDFSFSPSGSILANVSILIPIAVTALFDLLYRPSSRKPIQIIATLFIVAGSIFHLAMMTRPAFNPQLLPAETNWAIAIDAIKQPRAALIGVGPTGFLEAFTLFKPVTINSSERWGLLYQVGSNTPLTVLITLGALGTFFWFLLLAQAFRIFKESPSEIKHLGVLVLSLIGIQFFLPHNIVLLTFQFATIMVWLGSLRASSPSIIAELLISVKALRLGGHEPNQVSKNIGGFAYVLGTVILICIGYSTFLLGKAFAAEHYFFQSLRYEQQNNGNATYDAQRKAIQMNPYKDSYHRTYAQTNFALANALSGKEEVTEQDKTLIITLLQQSIQEAKIATQLNPSRSQNWKTLAEIYRALTGTTEGAEQWTVAAYVNAITTHPNDPLLRVDLGGVYLNINNPARALELFQQAIQLKPDYANAHYNASKAYELLKEYPLAVAHMETVLQLLDPASEEYIKAQQELAVLKEKSTMETSATPEVTEPVVPQEPTSVDLPEEVSQVDQTILEEDPTGLELSDTEDESVATQEAEVE